MNDFTSTLVDAFGRDRVKLDEPLRDYTTFRVGGPARWFVEPRSGDEIVSALRMASAAGVEVVMPAAVGCCAAADVASSSPASRHARTRCMGTR